MISKHQRNINTSAAECKQASSVSIHMLQAYACTVYHASFHHIIYKGTWYVRFHSVCKRLKLIVETMNYSVTVSQNKNTTMGRSLKLPDTTDRLYTRWTGGQIGSYQSTSCSLVHQLEGGWNRLQCCLKTVSVL